MLDSDLLFCMLGLNYKYPNPQPHEVVDFGGILSLLCLQRQKGAKQLFWNKIQMVGVWMTLDKVFSSAHFEFVMHI